MKVAVACQGGGMHAAFGVGVLTEILKDIRDKTQFELVGLSGTSAGALSTLMVWYGLAPKKGGGTSSVDEAISNLNNFWESFVASTSASTMLNLLTYGAFRAEEIEIPVLGVSARVFGLNPSSAFYKAVAASLPSVGVRKQYFNFDDLLDKTCPEFDRIDWRNVKTRLLIGASEVVNGFETVFDSDVNKETQDKEVYYWRQRLRLSLSGVAASGTLPLFREAEHIKGEGHYWDGLYSQNPPVREFFAGADEVPRRTVDRADQSSAMAGGTQIQCGHRRSSERTNGEPVAEQRAGFHSDGQQVARRSAIFVALRRICEGPQACDRAHDQDGGKDRRQTTIFV
jgi:NTE family protein